MTTSDVISLCALGISLAGAPFTVSGWAAVKRRRRVVSELVEVSDRYLAASGEAEDIRAKRGQACNELATAADAPAVLESSRLRREAEKLITAMRDTMNSGGDDAAVRAARTAVHKRRWF